jgi:hypothetical protein
MSEVRKRDDDRKDQITKAEREDLLRVARMRERVTKCALLEVGARLLVDFDNQLDAAYFFDSDEIWKQSWEVVQQAAQDANFKVKKRCRELGIPDRFAPSIQTSWRYQGEQAIKERRAERPFLVPGPRQVVFRKRLAC